MLLRFTKGPLAAKADRLSCIRDDGTVTEGDMPRQGILPHDLFHFAVESTLGWRDAFFGAVARGETLDQIARKSAGRKPTWSVQALQAESLVECLQAEQWGGAADPATFQSTLETTCRRRGVAAPELTLADLQRLRLALRELGTAWRPLNPGHSLERRFPAGLMQDGVA
ncbi:MAG TPA: hypothetical protein VHE61_23660 [Opitutaceae bacterium]|nr:hypothetical protein [Opitutaceae bacterium]